MDSTKLKVLQLVPRKTNSIHPTQIFINCLITVFAVPDIQQDGESAESITDSEVEDKIKKCKNAN